MPWGRLYPVGLALLLLPGCSGRGDVPKQTAPLASVSSKSNRQLTDTNGQAARTQPSAPAASGRTPVARAPDSSTAVPATPDALVDQAEREIARDNIEDGIRLLEQALAARPDDRKGLYLLAAASRVRAIEMDPPVRTSQFIRAGELIRKLRETYKDLSDREREEVTRCLYDEACAYALDAQPAKALDLIEDAAESGLDDPEMVIPDPDLASIRKLPRFTDLLRRIEQTARKRAAGEARHTLAETARFNLRFELMDINGKHVSSDDLKGQVIVVDFWGTWCPPCLKELPHLKTLLAEHGAHGLTIVGINYERVPESDVKETVRQFLADHEIPFPCLIGDEATRAQVPDFVGYPTLVFLDRSRKVRAKVAGYRTLIELEAIVELLLAEGTKSN